MFPSPTGDPLRAAGDIKNVIFFQASSPFSKDWPEPGEEIGFVRIVGSENGVKALADPDFELDSLADDYKIGMRAYTREEVLAFYKKEGLPKP